MRLILMAAAVAMIGGPVFGAPKCSGKLDLLSVTNWSIEAVDSTTNKLTVSITNESDKPVRMVDGSVGFIDALDKEIGRYEIDRDAEIPAGGQFEESGNWGRFTFERLLTLRSDEVTAFACVSALLYDDGTKDTFK